MAGRADWDQATRAQRQLARPNPNPNPNPNPPPVLSATHSRSPRTSRPVRSVSGSRTWPQGTGPSQTGSPTGRARRSRPKTPTTPTLARRSPPGPARAGSRSCGRPCPRFRPPRGSSNARQIATPTGKPLIEAGSTVGFSSVSARPRSGQPVAELLATR
jgi:hypothetical protein